MDKPDRYKPPKQKTRVFQTTEERQASKELVVDVSVPSGCETAAERIAKKHLGGVYRLRMVQVVDTAMGQYVRLNFEPRVIGEGD